MPFHICNYNSTCVGEPINSFPPSSVSEIAHSTPFVCCSCSRQREEESRCLGPASTLGQVCFSHGDGVVANGKLHIPAGLSGSDPPEFVCRDNVDGALA